MKWMIILLGLLAVPIVVVLITGMLLPKQHIATRSLQLQQPPDAVYALIAGPPTWRSSISSYEPVGKIEGKTHWREVDQHNHAITYEEEEAMPTTRRIVSIANKNLPFGGTWTYEIQPSGSGSVLRITENGEVYNPLFRFVSRYIMGHTATIDHYLKDVAAHFNEPASLLN
jgi:Polyketide cyclase / dehydrase and lipid transport